jgi:probable HAF family extracellular repeat protein
MKTNPRTIFVFICGLAVASSCFGQPRYTAKQIQFPAGFSSASLSWISDDGKTGAGSGWSVFSAPACFTYQDGSYTPLATPDFSCENVGPGNSRGEFVGTLLSRPAPGADSVAANAFVYRNGDFMRFNDLLPGQPPISFALGLNDNGDVAGVFQGVNQQIAFVYSNGEVRQLPDLGVPWTTAYAINNSGDVVGDSVLPTDLGPEFVPVHAALFPHDGGVIDLGTFGGLRSSAVAINSKGQVVGWGNVDANNSHAFFYDHGAMTEIMLPNGNAASINESGEVVGTYRPASDQYQRAFYFANGKATDLNTLTVDLPAGVTLTNAQRINNRGLILVWARTAADQPLTQFLLTPVSGN